MQPDCSSAETADERPMASRHARSALHAILCFVSWFVPVGSRCALAFC